MSRFLTLLGCILLFSLSDYCAARWGLERRARDLVAVLAIGPFAYLLFGHLAATTSLARMGAYVNAGIVVGTVLAGVVFLGERPGRLAWTGIAITAAGIAILSQASIRQGQP